MAALELNTGIFQNSNKRKGKLHSIVNRAKNELGSWRLIEGRDPWLEDPSETKQTKQLFQAYHDGSAKDRRKKSLYPPAKRQKSDGWLN